MKKILKLISDEMETAGVNYHFMKNKESKLSYPYFVGEILPESPISEDGLREYTFVITGFNRGTFLELLDETEKIENQFPSVEGLTALAGNEAIAVFSCGTTPINIGDGLQKTQTNLKIKTWKGGN